MYTEKSVKTVENILEKSKNLFAKKGFKSVTMTDICKETGLSRGGLYRYFSGTAEIFECIMGKAHSPKEGIEHGVPAVQILEEQTNDLLNNHAMREMNMTLAVMEYSSVNDSSFFKEGNDAVVDAWKDLIDYGMKTGEFKQVNAKQVAEMILYMTQGVFMWSTVFEIDEDTVNHIKKGIADLLIK